MRTALPFWPYVFCLLAAAQVAGQSAPPIAANMSLAGRAPLPACTTADCWAMGDYMLVARRYLGFSVIDLRNPEIPVVALIQPPGYPGPVSSMGVNDIKGDGRYIYVSSEISPGGVYIYDAAVDPMNPTLVGIVSDLRLLSGAHKLWIDGDYLYCAANGTRRIEVYDVTDRTAPVWVSSLGNEIAAAWAHDVVVLDGRAYCSFVVSGFAIYDVSNPRIPLLLGRHNYPNSFTHNVWPSEDRRVLYTTDENAVGGVGGQVKIWNISRLPKVEPLGSFRTGSPSSIVHNVYVNGDLLFIAYYREGVRVCSIEDPARPVEIASYDTFPSAESGCWSAGFAYAGCYGLYVWDRRWVLASDIDSGVYLLRLDAVPSTLVPKPAPAPRTLEFDFQFRNATPVELDAFGTATVIRINGEPVNLTLVSDFRRVPPGATVSHRVSRLIEGASPQRPMTFTIAAQAGTASPMLPGTPQRLTVTVR